MRISFSLSPKDIKRNRIAIYMGFVLTSIMVFGCIKSGIDKDDIMLRFREHQAVTMVSGLYLGATAMTSLCIYLIKRKSGESLGAALFWLLAAMGFFYMTMDECFMFHEGMDEAFGDLFLGRDIHYWNLDNMVIACYGLLAIVVCFYYRKVLLSYPIMFPGLFLGGICLFLTILFHSLERIHILYEIAEESFKVLGVIFFYIAFYLALLSSIDRLKLKDDH